MICEKVGTHWKVIKNFTKDQDKLLAKDKLSDNNIKIH